MTFQKPFGKMDPKRQLFAPGKRRAARTRKRSRLFASEKRGKLFSRG